MLQEYNPKYIYWIVENIHQSYSGLWSPVSLVYRKIMFIIWTYVVVDHSQMVKERCKVEDDLSRGIECEWSWSHMLDSLHVFCQKTENQLNWLKIINCKCVGVREVKIFLKLRIFISLLWVRIEMLLCLRYYWNI